MESLSHTAADNLPLLSLKQNLNIIFYSTGESSWCGGLLYLTLFFILLDKVLGAVDFFILSVFG